VNDTYEPHQTTGNVAAFALCKKKSEDLNLRTIIEDNDPDFAKRAKINHTQENSLDGSLDGISFSLMAVSAPYPDDELQLYCGHNILPECPWSQASSADCHIGIVVRGTHGQSPSREAILLAGRIALAFDPTAIIWSQSKSIISAETFKRLMSDAQTSQGWPHEIMVAVAQAKSSTQDILYTRGLKDFTGQEVSFEGDPGELMSLVAQILEQNILLKSGTLITTSSGKTLMGHSTTLPDGAPVFGLHESDTEAAQESPSPDDEASKVSADQGISEGHDVSSDFSDASKELPGTQFAEADIHAEDKTQHIPDEAAVDHEDGQDHDSSNQAQTPTSATPVDTGDQAPKSDDLIDQEKAGEIDPDDAQIEQKPERKIRARILHKKEQPKVVAAEHRSADKRTISKSKADPRETIESTLAAIRAASANEEPKEKPKPKWMFWKR